MKPVVPTACLACAFVAAAPAWAADPAATAKPSATPAEKPAGKTSDAPAELTITGQRKEVTERIDRRVYDIKNDPEAQTGMATDILAKLPSVQVSPTGKVSLRGDPGVSVLIDGKPPAGKDVAIQTLQAADIDRIEIMTNPSAQYAPDGTSGIINIITKRRHPAGISGNINNRLSSQGQEVFGASAVITKGPWSIDSRFGYIHSPYANYGHSEQTLPYVSSSGSHSANTYDNFNLPVTIAYKMSDIDTVSLQTQDYMRRTKGRSTGYYRSATRNYDVSNTSSGVGRTNGFDLILDHNNDKTGVHVTLDAGHSEYAGNTGSDSRETYAGGASAIYGNPSRVRFPSDDIKGDYENRLDASRVLTAGFEWSRNREILDQGYYDRGSVAGPNPDGYHHQFDGVVTISSVYATYQMPLGAWTILPGLRAEQEEHTGRSGTLSASGGTTKLYPSLHLSHGLGKIGKLKLSYSRRVDRPYVEVYDPGITYTGRTEIGIGNPALKPTDIDSYEAEYSYSKGASNYTAALYYRASSNLRTEQTTVRSDGILIYQTVNAGHSHSGGAEMTFKAPLSAHWKYSLSTNLYDKQTPLLTGGSRDDFNYGINGQIEYDAPAANGKGGDQVQTVFNLSGREYTPQGYRTGGGSLGIIWQHPVTPKVSMTITASNLLQTKETVYITRTSGVQSRGTYGQDNQTLMFALAYKFGAKKK